MSWFIVGLYWAVIHRVSVGVFGYFTATAHSGFGYLLRHWSTLDVGIHFHLKSPTGIQLGSDLLITDTIIGDSFNFSVLDGSIVLCLIVCLFHLANQKSNHIIHYIKESYLNFEKSPEPMICRFKVEGLWTCEEVSSQAAFISNLRLSAADSISHEWHQHSSVCTVTSASEVVFFLLWALWPVQMSENA